MTAGVERSSEPLTGELAGAVKHWAARKLELVALTCVGRGERNRSSWLAGIMLIFIVAKEGVAGLDQALKFNGITTKVGMNVLDLQTESGDHFMTAGICIDTE